LGTNPTLIWQEIRVERVLLERMKPGGGGVFVGQSDERAPISREGGQIEFSPRGAFRYVRLPSIRSHPVR